MGMQQYQLEYHCQVCSLWSPRCDENSIISLDRVMFSTAKFIGSYVLENVFDSWKLYTKRRHCTVKIIFAIIFEMSFNFFKAILSSFVQRRNSNAQLLHRSGLNWFIDDYESQGNPSLLKAANGIYI